MKKILTLGLVILSLAAFAQTPVQRASQANTVTDARLAASLNFFIPRYLDTASANLQLGVDSAGAAIYTRSDNAVWTRLDNPKRWVKLSGGGSPTATFQAVLSAGNTAVNTSWFLRDATNRSVIAAQLYDNGNGSSTGSFTVLNTSDNSKAQLWPGFVVIDGNLPFLRLVKTGTASYIDLKPQSLTGAYTQLLPPKSGTLATTDDCSLQGVTSIGTTTDKSIAFNNTGSAKIYYNFQPGTFRLAADGRAIAVGQTEVGGLEVAVSEAGSAGTMPTFNSTYRFMPDYVTREGAAIDTFATQAYVRANGGGGGSGGVAWGAITGTLSGQTDLQSALNAKVNTSDTATMLTPYLRQNVAAATYQPRGSYLTSYSETDPKRVSSLAFSGTTTKTLTLTLADATTVSNTFTDGGITTETDPYRIASAAYSAGTLTLTKADATTVTATGFPTNTNQLTNGANFITTAGARTAISLTTTGTGGTPAYDNTTGVLNVPVIPTNNNQLTNGSNYITTAGARTAISLTTTGTGGTPAYDNTTGVLNVPVIPTNTSQLTNGAGFVTAASTVSGSLVNVRFLTSGTTYTPTTGTTKAVFHIMGGGGGGGGVTGAASSVGAAAGGGAGGYLIKYSAVSDATTYTIAVGAGGTAGTTAGGNGGAGSQSFITIGATTYSAAGGAGGQGQTTGTAAALTLGGTAGSSTNGDVVGGGQNGDNGIRLSGTVGISGAGGTSMFGTGGAAVISANNGSNAIGYGSGGGGALSTANAAKSGGTGAPGVIIVYEYK